jgi:GT2 family glycosyltransferase
MVGCTVAYHHQRDRVQAWGGATFARWLARAAHIGAHAPIDLAPDVQQVEARLDYVLGAALAISKECLDAVGLMEERYFLYFEEIDWAERARRAGFTLGFAPDARVRHKEGGSIGSSADKAKRSLLSEHYLARSAIRFTRKFHPWFLPTVLAYQLVKAAQAALNGDVCRAWVRLRGMSGLPFVKRAGR